MAKPENWEPYDPGWLVELAREPTEGFIVLDILVNHRVGGVEFVDKI